MACHIVRFRNSFRSRSRFKSRREQYSIQASPKIQRIENVHKNTFMNVL